MRNTAQPSDAIAEEGDVGVEAVHGRIAAGRAEQLGRVPFWRVSGSRRTTEAAHCMLSSVSA